MNRWLARPVAGFAATITTTLLMEASYQRLPSEERYTLPPFEIAMNAMEKLGALEHLDDAQKRWVVAFAAHFGYGTASGLVYTLLLSKAPAPSAVKGMLSGAGPWTVSYLSLMPALCLLSSATRHPAQRNALMPMTVERLQEDERRL